MSHKATIIDLTDVGGGRWPQPWRKFYVTWWIGPYSKFVGMQVWRFRVNFHYDNWGKKKWEDDNNRGS